MAEGSGYKKTPGPWGALETALKTGAITPNEWVAGQNALSGPAAPLSPGLAQVIGVAPVTSYTDLPAGSFDPAAQTNSAQGNLGQLYNAQDFNTFYNEDPTKGALGSAYSGLNTAIGRAGEDLSTTLGGLGTQRDQGLADLLTALSNAQSSRDQSVADLQRGYQRLGRSQLQRVNAAGVGEGGALAQALAKRQQNELHDQRPIDAALGRYQDQNAQSRSRLNDAYATSRSAAQRAYDRSTRDYRTNYDNSKGTAQTAVGRGVESNAIYQGGLWNQTLQDVGGVLAANGVPAGYEYHNGVLYRKNPNGTYSPQGRN